MVTVRQIECQVRITTQSAEFRDERESRVLFVDHKRSALALLSAAAQVAAPRVVAARRAFMASAGAETDAGEASDDSAFEMELLRLPITGGGPELHRAQVGPRTAERTGFRVRPGSNTRGISQSTPPATPGGRSSPDWNVDLLRVNTAASQEPAPPVGCDSPGSPLVMDLFRATPTVHAVSTPKAEGTSPSDRQARVAACTVCVSCP